MKRRPLIALSIFAAVLFVTACSKTAVSSDDPVPDTITGIWNLVSDSTFEGIGAGNHRVNYVGQAGDFFNFLPDGYVDTKEGFILDTLTYRFVTPSRVIISDFGLILNGVQDTSTVTGLSVINTSHQTITIESPDFPTPGGQFWRKVTLTR
jgi:hypothetical protein